MYFTNIETNPKTTLRLITSLDGPLSDHGTNSTGSPTSGDSAIMVTPRPRQLRRKVSPTGVSLRELRQKHAYQFSLKAQKSEEELQRVYEAQIVAYLNGQFPSLDGVDE